jgi:hypothetical protein
LTSLALHRCLRPSAPSLDQASPPHGPSLQSLWLALHSCNWSIKPSLILIFSTLVTWLNVMSHMQWAPSSHIYLWTSSLCISYKYILVHLSCHSVTKTKQGPFRGLEPNPPHHWICLYMGLKCNCVKYLDNPLEHWRPKFFFDTLVSYAYTLPQIIIVKKLSRKP